MGKKLVLLILCLLLLITVACVEKNPLVDTQNEVLDTIRPKILRISSEDDISLLDQSQVTDRVSFEVLGNTLEGLFVLTGGNKLENGVCESYTVSEDGKTYTFKLRKDSVWSNGEAVTAHDFVYAWRRLGNTEIRSQYSFMLETAYIKNSSEIIRGDKSIEELGIKTEDDYTLVVELQQPVPYLTSVLSHPCFLPLNEEFVNEKGKEFGTSVENTLFNGPYALDKWEKENQYIYRKNENYWNKDSINIEEINVTFNKDKNIALNMYLSGRIDYVDVTEDQVSGYYDFEYLASKPDFPFEDLIATTEGIMFYLELAHNNEIMRNVNFRKALALSIEKRYITEEILKNGSFPADYLVPLNFALDSKGRDFRDTAGIYNHYNPQEAKKYWEKAKKELGIEKAIIVFWTYDSYTSTKTSNFIKGQLEANIDGLSVEIKCPPFTSSFRRDGTEDIGFAGWGADYLDPMTFLEMWTTNSGYNELKYSSNKYDSIIKSSTTGDLAIDPEKRWSELQRAERILLEEDVALIPLYQRGAIALLKDYVNNWNVNALPPHRYWGTMDIEE